MARKIAERYREVIAMPDFLDSVARNGAAWYDRNVAPARVLDLTTELLGLRADRGSLLEAGM